jgi:phosphoenolpyruvate carboxykinase (ATP)
MDKKYSELGLKTDKLKIHFQSAPSFLIQEAIKTGYGKLTNTGALVVNTGKYTGRCAKDRYIVKTTSTDKSIWWDNNLLVMTPDVFNKLTERVVTFLNQSEELFITERSVGAHEKHNIGCRLVTTHPSCALFSTYLFRNLQCKTKETDFTILHAPLLELDPAEFGTRSEAVIVTCFEKNITIIVGTQYAGEVKKSMFAAMNYRMPELGILPMHAGASRLANLETSLFFGLSGTGKTTLSSDLGTFLIGDDEHGLSGEGIFNFENGCYAKTFKLSHESEPAIWDASNQFGSLLENVRLNEQSGEVDFNDSSLTENGRSSYPLDFIVDVEKSSQGKIPAHIFFLTADAFGILPPVARLTKEQAMFYFVLGYTAKLAGTEIGIKEPSATFSPCFGAPFMLRHPSVYAKLLGEYLEKFPTNVWLINTGWTGGPYGEGERFPLKVTRQIIRSIQANKLNDGKTEVDPVFGLHIPIAIDGVDSKILQAQGSWKNSADYKVKAQDLALSFHNQMKKFGDFYKKNIDGAPLFNG